MKEFKVLRDVSISNCNGFTLGYDISNFSSFEMMIKSFLPDIESAKKCPASELPIVVIGNKCDLEDHREVPTRDGKYFAKKIGALFFETSVKTNHNVTECIESIVLLTKNWNNPKREEIKKRYELQVEEVSAIFTGKHSMFFVEQMICRTKIDLKEVIVPEVNKERKNVWEIIFKMTVEHWPARKRDLLAMREVCKYWYVSMNRLFAHKIESYGEKKYQSKYGTVVVSRWNPFFSYIDDSVKIAIVDANSELNELSKLIELQPSNLTVVVFNHESEEKVKDFKGISSFKGKMLFIESFDTQGIYKIVDELLDQQLKAVTVRKKSKKVGKTKEQKPKKSFFSFFKKKK